MASQSRVLFLKDYNDQVVEADRLPQFDLRPVLFGLFGEVGSIMTTAKKHYREREAFVGYQHAIEEEFGDVLWYFAALCRRLKIPIETIFARVIDKEISALEVAATDLSRGPIAQVALNGATPELETILLRLGEATAALLAASGPADALENRLLVFAQLYLSAVRAAGIAFAVVLQENIEKVRGRFLEPDLAKLPGFDGRFPPDEQLPENFEIHVVHRTSGQSHLKWNGVFIGDPLTDNIADPDGYRFHDVFHFAHAAILHWSPVFRALVKRKRKSDPRVDEAQDGGRAIVVEEGLTAWVFARAKDLAFFEDRGTLSFDLLKTVRQFVAGYEVQEAPLRLWEKAILSGYDVFRQVRANNGGVVVGDRSSRSIAYRSASG